MRRLDGDKLYSATDLITFFGCTHSTALDLLVLTEKLEAGEEEPDPYLDLLKKKGLDHERAYLDRLRKEGRSVREINTKLPIAEQTAATIAAMREGVDVIYQGALHRPPWHGYSDFLIRVD